MKHATPTFLVGETLTIDELARLARTGDKIGLSETAWQRIKAGRGVVDAALQSGKAYYGINTGVGSQKDRKLSVDEIAGFNAAMIVSESTIMPGPAFDPAVVRGALVVLLNNISTGRLGVRAELAERVVRFYNDDVFPKVISGTSAGISDLGSLAQLAQAMLRNHDEDAPFALAAKEGVSLINNNAFVIAHGALVLDQTARLAHAFDLAAAISLEAHRGNLSYMRAEMAANYRNRFQRRSFDAIRAALYGSALWAPAQWRSLHDPLSFRCATRVNGTVRMALDMALQTFADDLNCVCDNPIVSLELDEVVTGINMDSTPLTCVMDAVRQSIAMAASTSFERGLKVQHPQFSGLASSLADPDRAESGVQNLILPHVTAARMAKLRSLAGPVLLECPYNVADGIVDVAGMAPLSIQRTEEGIDLAWQVIAHEVLIAIWVMKLRELPPHRFGEAVRQIYNALHDLVPKGNEGLQVFDMAIFIERLKLAMQDLDEAGLPK